MTHGWSVEVRQQPKAARASSTDRRPIDPVIILQLRHRRNIDVHPDRETSSFFCCAQLQEVTHRRETPRTNGKQTGESVQVEEVARADRALTGNVLSSLYLLDDPVTSQSFRGAFFVFPDMSVRSEGLYRILFTVFGIRDESAFYLASCRSNNFQVYSAKRFPGMSNSTDLSRAFADQGLKIRIRKEVRSSRKRERDAFVESGDRETSLADDDTRESTGYNDWRQQQQPWVPMHLMQQRDLYGQPLSSTMYTHPYATSSAGPSTPLTPMPMQFRGYNYPDFSPHQPGQSFQPQQQQQQQHRPQSPPLQPPMSDISRITLPPIGNVFHNQSDGSAPHPPSSAAVVDPYGYAYQSSGGPPMQPYPKERRQG